MNADVFGSFIEQVLCPVLHADDIVVMDNLSSYKSASARLLIESSGATLVFLVPYAPDFNPIEMIFPKIKQRMRSVACTTANALWHATQSVLDTVTQSDAANCITHCGYTLQENYKRCGARVSKKPTANAAKSLDDFMQQHHEHPWNRSYGTNCSNGQR